MPGEPKKKHAKSRKRTRRASIHLGAVNLVVCKNCQAKTLSHIVCKNCGFYAGKKTSVKKQVTVTKA